jgi:hypothetical protein
LPLSKARSATLETIAAHASPPIRATATSPEYNLNTTNKTDENQYFFISKI